MKELVFVGEVFVQDTLLFSNRKRAPAVMLQGYAEEVSGAAFNSASIAGQLGCRPVLLAPYGVSDRVLLEQECSSRGIILSGALVQSLPTPRLWITLSSTRTIVYFGEHPDWANTAWRLDSPNDLSSQCVVLQGGRYPTTRTAFLEIVRLYPNQLAFNPSRNLPLYAPDELDQVLRASWLVQFTQTELSYVQRLLDIRSVSALLDLGPQLVIITRGAQGATLYDRYGSTAVRPYKVGAVNPVGAGDAFLAAFLCNSLRGVPNDQAGDFAAQVGAYTVSSVHTAPILPVELIDVFGGFAL